MYEENYFNSSMVGRPYKYHRCKQLMVTISGLLDVARRTYTELVDDIAGISVHCNCLNLLWAGTHLLLGASSTLAPKLLH